MRSSGTSALCCSLSARSSETRSLTVSAGPPPDGVAAGVGRVDGGVVERGCAAGRGSGWGWVGAAGGTAVDPGRYISLMVGPSADAVGSDRTGGAAGLADDVPCFAFSESAAGRALFCRSRASRRLSAVASRARRFSCRRSRLSSHQPRIVTALRETKSYTRAIERWTSRSKKSSVSTANESTSTIIEPTLPRRIIIVPAVAIPNRPPHVSIAVLDAVWPNQPNIDAATTGEKIDSTVARGRLPTPRFRRTTYPHAISSAGKTMTVY